MNKYFSQNSKINLEKWNEIQTKIVRKEIIEFLNNNYKSINKRVLVQILSSELPKIKEIEELIDELNLLSISFNHHFKEKSHKLMSVLK